MPSLSFRVLISKARALPPSLDSSKVEREGVVKVPCKLWTLLERSGTVLGVLKTIRTPSDSPDALTGLSTSLSAWLLSNRDTGCVGISVRGGGAGGIPAQALCALPPGGRGLTQAALSLQQQQCNHTFVIQAQSSLFETHNLSRLLGASHIDFSARNYPELFS